MPQAEPSPDLQTVLRWQASGGDMKVLDDGDPLVVSLCSCDGGQEMQRISSTAADLRAHLSG